MQLPYSFKLQRSRQLDLLLLCAHAGALAAAALAALPWWLRLALATAVVASAWLSRRRLAGDMRICALNLRADGRLDFERAGGIKGVASVLAQSTVSAWLTVLLLSSGERREAMCILPDALTPEDFRVLRLWLSWRAEI